MATPTSFPEMNGTLNAPPGMEDKVNSLPVHTSADGYITSCWRLSAEEVKEIVATGRVWMMSMGAPRPYLVSGRDPFRQFDLVTIEMPSDGKNDDNL